MTEVIGRFDQLLLKAFAKLSPSSNSNSVGGYVSNNPTTEGVQILWVGGGGGASEAPPKKLMMDWAETPICYRNIFKVYIYI